MAILPVSSARTEPRKLLNISTVYWLINENLDSSGLPKTRMRKQNIRPPSTIQISIARDGSSLPITDAFQVTRRFRGGQGARPPIHLKANQELEISLDPFFDTLPLGMFVLSLDPPANALSAGPAGPDTGDDDENRPGNCGARDNEFDGLFRPVRMRFEVVRVGTDLEIRQLQNAEPLARSRGPHWYAVLHPDMSSGARQRIMMDWKPDWIRRVEPDRKPVLRPRGRTPISMIVLHNTGGKRDNAETEGREFPNGGATVTEFLGHRHKGINYVVDVDGHVTKLAHEAFGTNHGAESNQTPKWDHVGTRPGQIRAASVGIEHCLYNSNTIFYPALLTASLDLVELILLAHETIVPWNLVGHNDLVSKAACPGTNFPWSEYEALVTTRGTPPLPFPAVLGANPSHSPNVSTMYNGFFATNPGGRLDQSSSDRDAIRELQSDLRELGYRFHTVTGRFDNDTGISVREFHSRFFNGSHVTPRDFTRARIQHVDKDSAIQLKRVLDNLSNLQSTLPPPP